MKNTYSLRHLMAFLSFFYCFSASIFAQSTLAPQTLPYEQNFDGLSATATVYPVGFQGWSVGTSTIPTPSNYVTSATSIADKALTASGSASSTSGNIYNYNGKIGFLTTSSLDLSIAFALETTGKKGII